VLNDDDGDDDVEVIRKGPPMSLVPGYEGYELLFDGDDSLFDESLPPPGGKL
jgi:hypothetical protein